MDIEVKIVKKEKVKPKDVFVRNLPLGTVFKYNDGDIGIREKDGTNSMIICDENGKVKCANFTGSSVVGKVLGKLVGIKVEEIE